VASQSGRLQLTTLKEKIIIKVTILQARRIEMNKIEIMLPPLIPHFLPFKKNRQRGCHIKVNKGVA
jgi:hypothetical protein